jgi:hypothetical protein
MKGSVMSKHKKSVPVVGDALLVRAQNLKDDEVKRLFFDPMVAKRSANDALLYLDKREEVLKRDYAGFDLAEMHTVPVLCDRASEQQRAVDALRGTRTVNSPELTGIALAWRRKLMPLAESLAVAGKLEGQVVARIRAGSGTVDHVRDVVELVVILSPHSAAVAALLGDDALTTARNASEAALASFGFGPNDPEVARTAADLRDRYATLIARGLDRIRVAVAALTSLSKAEELVAPLTNNGGGKRAQPAAPAEPPSV